MKEYLSILATIVLLMVTTASHGQSTKAPQDNFTNQTAATKQEAKKQVTVEVYQLQHIDPSLVQSVIDQNINGDNLRIAIDPRFNSIVVSASTETHSAVAEIIRSLDKPAESAVPELRKYILKSRKASDAAEFLGEFLGNREFKLSLTQDNSFIVASNDTKVFDLVSGFLEVIDKEPEASATESSMSCRVQLTWLTDKAQIPQTFVTRKVPKSLAKVEQYFKSEEGIELATLTSIQTVVQCNKDIREPSKFASRSNRKMESDKLAMQTSGTISLSNDNNVRLDISIDLASSEKNEPSPPVETSLELPLNHPVVFSVTEVDGIYSILVVEVSKAF